MIVDNSIGPMLTVKGVARILHIHSNTVRRWSNRGILNAYRINQRGDRRFKQEDITRFLAALNVNNGDERKAASSRTSNFTQN